MFCWKPDWVSDRDGISDAVFVFVLLEVDIFRGADFFSSGQTPDTAFFLGSDGTDELLSVCEVF